jgi:hypothetical protein
VGYHRKALNRGYPTVVQPSFCSASFMSRSWIPLELTGKNVFNAGLRARGRLGRRQNSSDPQRDSLGVFIYIHNCVHLALRSAVGFARSISCVQDALLSNVFVGLLVYRWWYRRVFRHKLRYYYSHCDVYASSKTSCPACSWTLSPCSSTPRSLVSLLIDSILAPTYQTRNCNQPMIPGIPTHVAWSFGGL